MRECERQYEHECECSYVEETCDAGWVVHATTTQYNNTVKCGNAYLELQRLLWVVHVLGVRSGPAGEGHARIVLPRGVLLDVKHVRRMAVRAQVQAVLPDEAPVAFIGVQQPVAMRECGKYSGTVKVWYGMGMGLVCGYGGVIGMVW